VPQIDNATTPTEDPESLPIHYASFFGKGSPKGGTLCEVVKRWTLTCGKDTGSVMVMISAGLSYTQR
jgi:hypothetical protein